MGSSYNRIVILLALSLFGCGSDEDARSSGSGGAGAGANNAGDNGVLGGGPGGAGSQSGASCQEYVVRAEPTTPDMLIVLDASGSMIGEGMDRQVDRWSPSRNAIESLTGDLDNLIRFGLMTFPGGGGGFGGNFGGGNFGQECTPGSLDVDVALGTSGAIAEELAGIMPGGFTPTADTLGEALDVLTSIPMQPDYIPAPQFLLLVTDGQPNCSEDFSFQNPSDPIAEQDSYEAIDALTAAGVKTYVIGYDTQGDAQLGGVLDEMAQRGGTGDTAHRPVEDEASLRATFEAIAGTAVSCNFVLDQAVVDPSFVLVTLDGEQLNIGESWELLDGNQTVQLTGASCSTLQDGGQHTLGVTVLCDPVSPI